MIEKSLPVWDLHDALRRAWREVNRIVLVAPTGSGKTTQICQMVLQDGRNHGKRIVVLQPRRVAARSVARRVAEELGSAVGDVVGYQVRFDDSIAPQTRIAFITEGILLRWLQADPTLSDVGAILFDEFHERNLRSDISLALVKDLQQRARTDLLLMVMSATLDSAPLSEYLGNCPVLLSSGRAYPVDIRYQEWADERPAWELAAEQVAHIVQSSDDGDILVFMPGAYEIARTMEELRRARIKESIAIIPLHGELSPHDQDRAFIGADYRRVIVSTNVAETSVTLPGIRYVVDSGLARVARFDTAHGISTLHVEHISQSSADQRAGRAGRLGPGVCFRLWTQADHNSRPARNTPEIQRSDLAEVVLMLHAWGVTDAAHFDLLDQPAAERVRMAEVMLTTLGAITPAPHRITAIGRRMLALPLHPRYSRMMIEAEARGCMGEVALFASLVSGRDLLTRLNREDKSAQRNRAGLTRSDQSDYHLLAASFRHAVQCNFDYKQCYSFGVNPHVAKEVAQTYRQMLALIRNSGTQLDAEPAETQAEQPVAEHAEAPVAEHAEAPVTSASSVTDAAATDAAIRRCHLAGFVDQVALRVGGSEEFDLVSGQRGTLMQESIVRRSNLLVVSEVREITTRQQEKLTLIGVASAIDPQWLRELNPPQLHEVTEYVYDRLSRRVIAARVLRYADLVISAETLADLDPQEAALALAREFVRNPQPTSVPRWERELKPWLLKLRKLAIEHPEYQLPQFDDDLLVRGLAAAWHGAASYKDAAQRPLQAAFEAMLSDDQRRKAGL